MNLSSNLGLLASISGLVIFVFGIGLSSFQKKPTLFSYLGQIKSVFSQARGDDYFRSRPKISFEPFEINIKNPNSELGYDSEYILNISTEYTIATLPVTIKLPPSVMTDYVSLFNDNERGERAWYNHETKGNKATFRITNANGKYHLILGHKNKEQLTIDDINW